MLKRLRHRLVVATCALVVGVAALFSAGLWLAFELAEDTLFEAHLAHDVESLMRLYEHDPSLTGVRNDNFIVYVAPNGSTSDLPAAVAALALDADDLVLDGREYDVEVRERGASRYYFLFDESAFEAFENVLFLTMSALVAGIVVGGGWVGVRLANRLIHPLSALSNQVATLDGSADGGVRIDAGLGSDDEIAVLAKAINGYHQRISALLNREREFSSDVSHELRTPLMGVLGAAELLERRVAERPELVELIQRIRRGCHHMTTLTEALLYLARDPVSFRELVEPVSIAHVVENQLAAVREVAERKGIVLNVEKTGEAATIQTIPAVANIVIGNILKNAVKYTDHDTVSVFITPREVVVQDYGPGIDQSVQETLFDRFNRGANRNPDGTGIGLALVKRFCDEYGWAIDFRSEVEKGTRIAVAF